MNENATRLRVIKTAHTTAWAFFVTCIVSIPMFAWTGRFRAALIAIAIVAVEVVVIVVNGWHCPLTPIAARYTDDRRPNFDIYLPEWLARYNKEIFGTLFGAGLLITAVLWLRR